MAQLKQAMNLTVPQPLADAFYAVCDTYGHGKQKGMILSAAILMFLEADPKTQGAYLKAVTGAEIDQGVREMETKSAKPHAIAGRPRMAAKHAGKSVHALYALPKSPPKSPEPPTKARGGKGKR